MKRMKSMKTTLTWRRLRRQAVCGKARPDKTMTHS
jgi:hypothetical protein